MSDIYNFHIESIKERELTIYATIVHPDVDWVEDTKNLALQIILEPYSNIANGYIYNATWQSYPFDQKQGDEFIRTHPLKDQMKYWLELMRGKEVEITEEEYNNMDKLRESDNPKFKDISSWGMSNGKYHVSYNPNYKAFMNVAEIAIENVEMTDVEHMPWKHNQMSWEEREKITDEEWDEMYEDNPSCTLKITVLNEGLLYHLKEGANWASAMYDFTYYAR